MKYKGNIDLQTRCLECGHEITYGRTDKKFCCEECKNKYHNRTSKEYIRIHSKTIRALDKNYGILLDLIRKGYDSAELGDLIQWGFSPNYVTGVRCLRRKTEHRCYNIKYYYTESRIYGIQKVDSL